ncbi:MAG: P-loop NTPase fold protein [Anaerolineales bacterium]
MNAGTSQQSDKNTSIFEPIKNLELDALGRFRFARQLLRRVAESDCPTTIGLYGGWGTGKTSILYLMQASNSPEHLQGLEQPIITYIDAWPYEISGDLTLPIVMGVRGLIKKTPDAAYSRNWQKVIGVVAQASLDIALRRTLNIELGDVEKYADNIKNGGLDQTVFSNIETMVKEIQGAQVAFRELVELACKENQNRRIVFQIDNLDRCSPENVVRLLESIKNFLYAPQCTWVFAMDSGVIASYIDRKYEGTRMDGNSYLDKIIPEQFHIPPVSGNDMAKLQKFLSRARPTKFANLPTIDLTKIPQLPEVLIPRRLLKTAHRFYKAYTTPTQHGAAATPDMIFALILLYNSWPAFYERFSSESPEHVRGILANFIVKEQNSQHLIPLPQTLINDRSLVHYIHHCFIKGQDIDKTQVLLAGSMAWLHEAGLP